ncbi:YTH domain containing protein [Parasponia andersonii]|uniref:YTH domain-containing family protein n=1 Tax=Parasponia andersonii TaxID=3476 RepID=A0A2P5CV29_PARAD|nr:YTH domain containing protein [Parasponia andersonii]
MYHVSENGNHENYMIQGMDPNMRFTSPPEQVEAMYNEGAPEFVVDRGLLYPAATSYGYYCTGFESPGEWEDHHRIFGVDGPDVQYTGAQNESLPYVYYTSTYGYAQSPYNPYNPYIPGAMIGVDGPFVGAQQYYSASPYHSAASSPAYIPVVLQPDMIPSSSPESLIGTGASITRPDGRGSKHNFNSASGAFSNSTKPTSNMKNSMTILSEGSKSSVGPSRQAATHKGVSIGSFPSPASSHVLQGRNSSGSTQAIDNHPNGKVLSHHNQLKIAIPGSNSLSDFGANNHGRATVAKLRPKVNVGRSLNDINSGLDSLGEQNRGPRINRSKNELAVKAYTTRAGGGTNSQGNIIIYTDQYNKDDFPVEYSDAKFFVIKSYSEDDVHKSIKYSVWSSTPHGNKKLSSAYEEAQKIAAGNPRGCPIFLFFSVNVSGQFCGVAEMIGPVDFNKDMDFWQQDKWSGSFPVKWHIIKDVPNTSLRHIVMENNENKPVTNSRDTQEIMYKKGLEMLKLFKNQILKSSLLDDFLYYENRQKIIQEEKARLLVRSFESPFFVSALGPPRKLNCVVEMPPSKIENANNLSDDPNNSKKTIISTPMQVSSEPNVTQKYSRNEKSEQTCVEGKDSVSALKIGSLSINPKPADPITSVGASTVTNTGTFDVTIGSVPIKLNGSAESHGILTVGTIPLDPRTLLVGKKGSQQI